MRFAYSRPDGGVSIVIAAPKEHLERALGKLTDDQYRAHVVGRSIPADAVDVVEIKETPQDRTFRDAWKLDGGKVEHDMDKCRSIHRGRLRKLRAPLLAELDIEYQRADEDGDNDKKKDIAKRKQALRDVTDDPAIENAKTPEELRAVIPSALSEQ